MSTLTSKFRIDHALPTLVALHAGTSTPRQWLPLIEAARGRWNVIAPPLLGYEDAPATGAATTLRDHVDYLHGLLQGLPGPVHLAGHSMGGVVALRYATRYPARVASLSVYEAICFDLLFGAEGGGVAGDEINHQGNLVVYRVRRQELETAARLYVDYWNGRGAWEAMSPDRQRRLVSRMPAAAWEIQALFREPPDAAHYAFIETPVQVLSGNLSPEPARQAAARLAQLVPGAVSRELVGLGHLGPVLAPERVNPLLLEFAAAHATTLPRAA